MNNSIDVPVVLLMIVAMFFWCLVTYTIGYKQGKADGVLQARKARRNKVGA
jgi:membrane protein DedA with SNARE-associated domain